MMLRFVLTLGLAAVAALVVGCPGGTATQKPQAAVEKIPGEPTIRVRLDQGTREVTFTGPASIQIHAAKGEGRKHLLETPVTVARAGNAWTGPLREASPGRLETLIVEPVGPSPLYIGDTAYPGKVHLVPVALERNDRPASAARAPFAAPSLGARDGFDVVSHVGIETYLPGVLERELYANFQPATYLAQAIVARTYAIARIIERGPGSHFDVESTVASQVYGGQATRPIARRAAADTAGLVLAWDDQIFTTYYSSACGGVRQAPGDVFGEAANTPAPLIPQRTHSWCEISPRFEWGPVRRDRQELSRRIAAWGAARNLAISELGSIRDARVVRTNDLGRPVRFRLTDETGRAYELRADSLRHASNHHDADKGLPAVSGGAVIRSGHFDVQVRGDRVHFTNGRGFGHGVGFCQFGAEGMARAGHSPTEILAENYPGADIAKAY